MPAPPWPIPSSPDEPSALGAPIWASRAAGFRLSGLWRISPIGQTQWRLDQLDRCLSSARERWDNDQCLRRDEQARERQRRRDQQEWQLLMGRQGFTAQLPGRPGLSL